MFTLTTTQKAPLLGPDGEHLTTADVTVGTSNGAILGVEYEAGPIFIVGKAVGLAGVNAQRLADGATANLDVEVTLDEPLAPFTISLGAPVPK